MAETGSGKTFRLVQAGCGSMARKWVKYALARPDIEIAALVDIHLPAAEAMARDLGLSCPCFTELEQAIRTTGANLVFDATIPEVHKRVVMTAVGLGCDVLGEKPMAVTMADAYEVVESVRKHGRCYSVMQNRRFARQIREAQGMIREGRIGRPAQASADFFLGPHFGGFRDLMDHPLLLDMAIHTFDQARYLLQADPVSVYCHVFNPPHSWYRGHASAVCIFEMSGGAVFTYNGSWCAEGEPTSWQGSWRIVGSEGTLIWDGESEPYCSIKTGDPAPGGRMSTFGRIGPAEPWTGREGHDGCLDEMLEALKEGRPAETDCSDNLMSMAMVFAAIESAERGAKVRIDPYRTTSELRHYAVFLPMKSAELSVRFRAEHLQFLADRRAEGKLLANGRFADGAGGLVIYRGATLEEVESWVRRDPYIVQGARSYEIHEWELVMSPE